MNFRGPEAGGDRPHKTMVCPTSESAKCRKSIAPALAGASLRTDYRGGPCARVPQKEWYAEVACLYHNRKDPHLHVGPDPECGERRGRGHPLFSACDASPR